VNSDALLFRPDDEVMSCCENVYEEWCPNSKLFGDAGQARRWGDQRGMSGRVMDPAEASRLGMSDWADVVQEVAMPKEIDREGLRRMVAAGAQLVEVLPAEEYAEDHLPQAISIPLRHIDAEGAKVLDKDRAVIVYCWDSA